MSHISLIIQARMGSVRLPGKSLLNLAGETLVGRILERVKKCKLVDSIILAIPDTKENHVLVEVAAKFGVDFFKGSENDLVRRYLGAAKSQNADYIVRLPADNVAPEALEIDKIINFHIKSNSPGFSTNLCDYNGSGYPDGIGAEIFDTVLLEQIVEKGYDEECGEHVHKNFINYEENVAVDVNFCKVATIKCPQEYRRPDIVLDVNTEDQYLLMKEMYEDLYPLNSNFDITDIIRWWDGKHGLLEG